MNGDKETFIYKNFDCEAEYEFDDKLFYPVKIGARVPTNDNFEFRAANLSGFSFESKEDCMNFLIHETQKFIDNDFEIKK